MRMSPSLIDDPAAVGDILNGPLPVLRKYKHTVKAFPVPRHRFTSKKVEGHLCIRFHLIRHVADRKISLKRKRHASTPFPGRGDDEKVANWKNHLLHIGKTAASGQAKRRVSRPKRSTSVLGSIEKRHDLPQHQATHALEKEGR